MQIQTDIKINFTEEEIIDILKKHLVIQGYVAHSHTNKIEDCGEDDNRGPYIPEYKFTGISFSVDKKDTIKKRTGNKNID